MSRYSFDKEFNIHASILYHWIQVYVKYGGRAFLCKGSALFRCSICKLKKDIKGIKIFAI